MTLHPLDRVARKPITCMWELTRACNLRCIHCENFGGKKSSKEMTWDQMMRLADSLQKLGCKVVDITGGEPLLHPHWHRLANELNKRSIRTALITNGTLLDEEKIDRAVSSGIEAIAVSIDGPKEINDQIRKYPPGNFFKSSPFERAIEGLSCASGKIKTMVLTQINTLNINYLEQMRKMLVDINIEVWQLQLAVPIGRVLEYKKPLIINPSHIKDLIDFIVTCKKEKKKPFINVGDTIGYYTEAEKYIRKRSRRQGIWLGCQAGIRMAAITYEGKVRGCSILPPEFDAGDLHEESFEDIWNDAKRFAYNTSFNAKELKGDCAKCSLGFLCRAGCTSLAYYSTGTIYTNPFCINRPGVHHETSDKIAQRCS